MSWVKLDDQARQHRKLLAVGPTAAWLWVCGLMYCNAQKARDGFIPTAAVQVLYPIPTWKKEVPKLVAAGLWEAIDGGFVVHDYHDYQPTAEQAAEVSETKAAAGRLGGLRSGDSRRRRAQADTEAPLEADAKHAASVSEADAKQDASLLPKPVPSRPDPDQEDQDPHSPQGGQVGLTGITPPAEKAAKSAKPDRVRDLFDRFTAIRKRHKPQSRGVSLKPEERKRAESLLASGYTVEDLTLACEGLFLSPHHQGKNISNTEYLTFFCAMSQKTVDGLIELGRQAQEPETETEEPAATVYGPPVPPTPEQVALLTRLTSLGARPKPRPGDAFGESLAAAGETPGAPVFWSPKTSGGRS